MPLSVILGPPPDAIDPALRDWLHRLVDAVNASGAMDSKAFSATPEFDAANCALFEMTLTGNVTSSTIINGRENQRITLKLKQDAVGGWTFAWPSNVTLQSNTVVDPTANATSMISLIYNGTTWTEDGFLPKTLAGMTLTSPVLNSPDVNTPDIDGGTIDNTVIGGSTPAAGTFTTAKADHIGEKTAGHDIVHDNIVGNPVQPAFCAYLSATQSNLVINGDRTLQFDSEFFDIGGNFDTGTYTFTAPRTGIYLLGCRVRLDQLDTATTYYILYLKTTARSAYFITPQNVAWVADFSYMTMQVTEVFQMTAGDTAYCYIKIPNAGANQADVIGGNQGQTTFWGYFLG